MDFAIAHTLFLRNFLAKTFHLNGDENRPLLLLGLILHANTLLYRHWLPRNKKQFISQDLRGDYLFVIGLEDFLQMNFSPA